MANLLALVQSNPTTVALVLYAVLDLVILLNPKLDSNGLVHLVLSYLAGKSGVTLPGETPKQ